MMNFYFPIGGLFSKTEMSEVLTEILKVDPNFDKDSFLKQCEKDIIPNVLEVRKKTHPQSDMHLCATLTSFIFLFFSYFFFQAMIQGELEVLKDWCYEAVCGHNSVLTNCFLMCWMNRNFRDSLFLLPFL